MFWELNTSPNPKYVLYNTVCSDHDLSRFDKELETPLTFYLCYHKRILSEDLTRTLCLPSSGKEILKYNEQRKLLLYPHFLYG
jgi:hypothetical protein